MDDPVRDRRWDSVTVAWECANDRWPYRQPCYECPEFDLFKSIHKSSFFAFMRKYSDATEDECIAFGKAFGYTWRDRIEREDDDHQIDLAMKFGNEYELDRTLTKSAVCADE